jgi:ferritin
MKLEKLISDDIESFLNKAIQHERTNTQLYAGMYSWLVNSGFNNAGEVMLKWSDEEMTHAHKVEEYIDDRNACIIIPALEKPPCTFKSIMEVLMAIFDREVATEELYKVLQTKALREADHPTHTFATWFISEQKEEIVKIRKLIDYANLLGEGNPMLNYFIDQEFKELL